MFVSVLFTLITFNIFILLTTDNLLITFILTVIVVLKTIFFRFCKLFLLCSKLKSISELKVINN